MDSHEGRLGAFLAGEPDEASAERFDAHLLECAECWRAVGEHRAGRAAAARLREPAPPALADRVRMAVELAGARPDRRRRDRRRAGLLAAVGAAVAAAATALVVVVLPGRPTEPPSVSAVVEAVRRMPSPPGTPSLPGPGAIAQGAPWSVRAGVAHLRFQYYLLDGTEVLVARSDLPLDPPEGARTVLPGGMPWTLERDGISVYCPRDDVLIAAAVPADRLAALARRLPV